MSFGSRWFVLPFACVASVIAGCAPTPTPQAAAAAAAIVDDFGDTLWLGAPPARIVSLTPATTELLFAIGAGSRVVGRTTWDSWPAEALAVPDLGPGLRPNVEAVIGVQPDLVLLYAAEDNRAAARQLKAAGVPTLTLRVDRIADFARATTLLGRVLGDSLAAARTRDSVLATLGRVAVEARARGVVVPRVAVPLGDQPLYVIGGPSFLGELVDSAGGRNAFGDLPQPSPQVSFEELVARDPDVLVMSGTGWGRAQTAARWQMLRAVRDGRVIIADSLLTGRPGPRIGEAAVWLAAELQRVMAAPGTAPR